MYCKHCGTSNDNNSKYCTKCGKPIQHKQASKATESVSVICDGIPSIDSIVKDANESLKSK